MRRQRRSNGRSCNTCATSPKKRTPDYSPDTHVVPHLHRTKHREGFLKDAACANPRVRRRPRLSVTNGTFFHSLLACVTSNASNWPETPGQGRSFSSPIPAARLSPDSASACEEAGLRLGARPRALPRARWHYARACGGRTGSLECRPACARHGGAASAATP